MDGRGDRTEARRALVSVQLYSTVVYTKPYWTNIQGYRSITDPSIVCAAQVFEASVKSFGILDQAKCVH